MYWTLVTDIFWLNLRLSSLLCLKLQSLAYFAGKSVVLPLLKGPELRMHYQEDREEKKPCTQRVLNPPSLC